MPSLNTVIKQASRGADLYFVFRFLRLLTMKYEKTDAFKYGIIDKKGNPLKRSSDLESVDEKAAYTMLHRLVFKVRRLIEKVPVWVSQYYLIMQRHSFYSKNKTTQESGRMRTI